MLIMFSKDTGSIWNENENINLFIFSVANGEPPIGIPWETFQIIVKTMHEARLRR